VALLARHQVPLIEDDVYGELYFGNRCPLPAKAFDTQGLVMHCSSFSKTLAPGFRIGWVAPGRFGEAIQRLKLMTTLSAGVPAQVALAEYLQHGGYDKHLRKLRHVLEVRHDSFRSPDYLKLARKYKTATVFTDSPKFPSMADLTADFVYARLMESSAKLKTGYGPKALDQWAGRAQSWAQGAQPDDLPMLEDRQPAARKREVYIFFINGAKERAPAAAQALLERLGWTPPADADA